MRPTKSERRELRRDKRRQKQELKNQVLMQAAMNEISHPKQNVKPVEAKTEAQAHYLISMKSAELTFGVGPAGTGKTYLAAAFAAEMLEANLIEQIIVTRPAVEAGENLGFLPGELDEKFEPFLRPFIDVFNERFGRGHADYLLRHGTIEAAPLAYMRGRTFKKALVILDEAQNTTPAQMKMFLTRLGEGTRCVVNGDPAQSDIDGPNGLNDAMARLKHLSPRVRICMFDRGDVVRSGLVQKIVEAYETKPLHWGTSN